MLRMLLRIMSSLLFALHDAAGATNHAFFVGQAARVEDTSASFPTIAAAAAAVRAVPLAQRCGTTVTIAGGVYTGETNALRLTAADSGCAGNPVVYRADPADPVPVVLSGGAQLEPGSFTKSGTTPAGLAIWEVDLAALGLSKLAASSGNFHTGWSCANGNRTELFFAGNAMTLARHPNKEAGTGTWQYLRQGATLDVSAGKLATSFTAGTDDTTGGNIIAADTPWLKGLGGAAWVHGFFSWDWADSFAPVKGIRSNGTAATVELGSAPAYGLKPGSRYLFLNSKNLLDAPGEYYIDGSAAKLFFIPPAGADPSKQPVTTDAGAFLSAAQHAHTINGTAHVTVSGLRLEHAVSSALWIREVTGVTIHNCTLANSGTHGVELTKSSDSAISHSNVYDVGCDGVAVNGGDPIKLISANLNVHNNTIHAFARVSRTIRPGVAWGGCGLAISGNEIYDAPHSGIMIAPASDGRGANCIFEDNHLHDLCKGTADAGGFYAGRTWSNRGNVVRRNTFKRFYQTEKMNQATSVNGIYLDDQESGWLVEDNYFESTTRCMFIGGGRQNIVRGNTFVNCTTPLHIDGRGLGTKCDHTGNPTLNPSKLIDELEHVFHYRQSPWATAFPTIDVSLAPCAPALNTIVNNRFCQPKPPSPLSAPDCATCPAKFRYPYTPSPSKSREGSVTGSYCCTVPTIGKSCKSASICCLTPGSQKNTSWGSHGCEGLPRCGNNPSNKIACQPAAPPPPPGMPPGFTDFTGLGVNVSWLNVFRNNTVFDVCPPSSYVKTDDGDGSAYVRTPRPPPPPYCPPGPWHESGRVEATHSSCGLVGDGVTAGSGALAACLRLAANCSATLFFPPGRFWLPTTVVLSRSNGSVAHLLGSGRGASFLCKCANCSGAPHPPNYDQCGPSASGLLGPRGPVLQIGDPLGKGTDGAKVDGFTIRGVELAVFIVNCAGISIARSEVTAGAYDGGDMDAAMIVTNGFEFYFEEMAFWGGNRADYIDCHGSKHSPRNASKCHSSPSVILRGVGAPNSSSCSTKHPCQLFKPFYTATAYNSSGLQGAEGTPYVYMIRFERTLFDFGGVQYQQWTDLNQMAVVWHHYLTCFSESAGTPLVDYISAPWVQDFRIEGVTIDDYSNWDEFSDDAIVRLNASKTNNLLDGLTITASSGGTSHSAVEVVSGRVMGTTLQNGHWYGTDDVRTSDGKISGTFVGRSSGGTVHVGDLPSLLGERKDNSSTLSGESGHTFLMGVGGEANARYAMDADGVELHGPGGDAGFDTIVQPPRVAAEEWDPPAIAMMGMASRVLVVPGARAGAIVTVSHEGTAARDVEGAAMLLWSAQCSGEDEVTVVVLNPSPLEVDLPLGTLRLMVTHVDKR
jgi:hypothetical protein